MIVHIDKRIEPSEAYASARTRGLYNVDVEDGSNFRLDAELPVEADDWQIGVVVGPSGSGKTSIAQALNAHGWAEWHPSFEYDGDGKPIIEVLSEGGTYAKATASLAAVGLGSVPSWLRPFHVLSNGEQFRASLADLLLASDRQVYIDEFTSVLDRQVAKVGAGAFAKAWRRQEGRQAILITPHYDILDWVQPDWYLDTAGGETLPGEERKVVQAQVGDFQLSDHSYSGVEIARIQC